MSELPMRGHFQYLRFKTFSMTLRTRQCEVFCPLLSSSKHSRVLENSQPPTFPSVGLHPHTWPKWGCDTLCHPPSLHLSELQRREFHCPPSLQRNELQRHQRHHPPSRDHRYNGAPPLSIQLSLDFHPTFVGFSSNFRPTSIGLPFNVHFASYHYVVLHPTILSSYVLCLMSYRPTILPVCLTFI